MTKGPTKEKDEQQARENTHNQSNKEITSRIYKEKLNKLHYIKHVRKQKTWERK